jgi:hypothetical protein
VALENEMPASPSRQRPWTLTVVVSALLATHALVSGTLFPNAAKSLAEPRAYAEALPSVLGFGATWLRRTDALPLALSLDDRILAEPALATAIAQTIFPTRVRAGAPHSLSLLPVGVEIPANAREVGTDARGRRLVLHGPPFEASSTTRAPPLDPWALLAGLVAWFGIGAIVVLLVPALRRTRSFAIWLASAALAGATVYGLLGTAAVWLEAPIPWRTLHIAALVLAPLLLAAIGWRARSLAPPRLPKWEGFAFTALVALFVVRIASAPRVVGDGRSIWFFRAKQLALEGTVFHADLLARETAWSQPEYPLLLPSLLAGTTAHGGSYDERAMALVAALFLAALLATLWSLARERVGRWPGAAIGVAALVSFEELTASGYVDGFLALLLAIGVLARSTPSCSALAFFAAVAASLVKVEGVVLSALVAIVFLFRSREGARAHVLAGLALLPGAAHALFAKGLGIAGAYAELDLARVLETALERVAAIAAALPSATARYPIFVEALCALALAAFLTILARRARKKSGDAGGPRSIPHTFESGSYTSQSLPHTSPGPGVAPWRVVAITAAFAAFAVGAIFVTPLDVTWHAATALDRLLLHASLLALVVPFYATTSRGRHARDDS